MKLAHVESNGRTKIAVVLDESAFDLAGCSAWRRVAERRYNTIDELLAHDGLERLLRLQRNEFEQAPRFSMSKAKFASPVLSPEKILLAAVNYTSHRKEKKNDVRPAPYFFTKFRNALIGDKDPILIPNNSKKADWEVELAVVIGKKAKHVSKSSAMEHVAGYAVSNDISFRDLQFPTGWPKKLNTFGQNWVMGKGLDNAFPLGPFLVTRDEIEDVYKLNLTLKVNGDVRQKASTADMIFGVEELIAYLSRGITLMPGDVISTGTPGGVAAYSGAPFLKPGDMVEASISGIGTLHNPVVRDVADGEDSDRHGGSE